MTRRRSGLKAPLIVTSLIVGGGALAVSTVPGLGASIMGLFRAGAVDVVRYPVKKMVLPVTVVERGQLESSNNKDVLNEVEGMTTIIKILPEGSQVKAGDLVCELDSASLTDQLINQEIATKRAEADLAQAEKTLEVAKIAVQEYVEGTFPEQEQSAEGAIALAQSELVRAQERLEWSDRMLSIGYVPQAQNYSDRLSLQRAEFNLKEAETKLMVLRKYTREKQIKELEANVEKAQSSMLAMKSTYELEKAKEEKLRKQIEKCKLFAPSDGLVVYANDNNMFRGGSNQPMIEEGAQVRERQAIFRLPDISKMRVNTKVNEAMIDRVTKGLKARIRVDAFAQQVLSGTVETVQPLPDPTSFFSSDVKVYTTLVSIDNAMPGLRPGMSAQVEILVTQLNDVLAVPVQAIVEYKGKDYVYVRGPNDWQRREVKLGISNDKLIEVKEGLQAGEEVALSPTSLMTEQEKREAFAVATRGRAGTWSKDAVDQSKAASAASPGEAKGKGGPGEAKAKRKGGGRGGFGAQDPAMQAIFEKIPQEDRRRMFMGTPEERSEILKKAGATDAQIQQLEEGMRMMRERMQQGGGGSGGPGGGGGFGGPGGGGGGGGPQS